MSRHILGRIAQNKVNTAEEGIKMDTARLLPRLLLLVFGAAVLILAAGTAGAQNSKNSKNSPKSRYRIIDDAGDAARSGDEKSVRVLADEVFKFPPFPDIPSNLQPSVKERLVQAEIAYRQGRGQGVEEQNIADAVNLVSDRLAAPDSGKTSVKQVRYLRMHLVVEEPRFMGSSLTRPGMKIGDSVNSTMSPMEAAHLIANLINQKLGGNPKYAVPPAEWDQTHGQKQDEPPPSQNQNTGADPLQAFQGQQQQAQQPQGKSSQTRLIPGLWEIYDHISKGLFGMSDAEGLRLTEDVFKKLGIQ